MPEQARIRELDMVKPLIARLRSEWHEHDGPVCWWAWCGRIWADEPPWIGTPIDDDWPGYHTHWTLCPPVPAAEPAGTEGGAA